MALIAALLLIPVATPFKSIFFNLKKSHECHSFYTCLLPGIIREFIIAGSSGKKYLINGEWKNLEQMKESLHY